MTRYPTLERIHHLTMPTLVIAGERDPLVRIDRVRVLSDLRYVQVVKVPGAHALNFSSPEMVAALIDAHVTGAPLTAPSGPLAEVEILDA